MRLRHVAVGLVAIALPIALAGTVYATAARSLAVAPAPTAITTRAIAAPATTTELDRTGKDRPPATTTGEISGNCDEAEHASDPECTPTTTDDGRESDGGSDDSENSGKGSENSGSGGGDD